MPDKIPNKPFLDDTLQDGDLPTVVDAASTATTVMCCGPMPGDPSTWLTCSEVAERLGVSDQTVLNWADKPWFPSPLRIGHRTKWAPIDLRLLNDYIVRRSKDLAAGGSGNVAAPQYCV